MRVKYPFICLRAFLLMQHIKFERRVFLQVKYLSITQIDQAFIIRLSEFQIKIEDVWSLYSTKENGLDA